MPQLSRVNLVRNGIVTVANGLTSVKEWDARYDKLIDKEAGKIPDKEKVEEWASDFKSYVYELDITRDDYRGIIEYIDDAIAILRQQEPRVITANEVKRIGADNFCAWSSEDLTILWVEGFGKNGIAPVVAKWDEDDWNGEPNDIIHAYYFGSDLDEKFNLNEYNKTWRLWTNKPTKTQRMGATWDAAD